MLRPLPIAGVPPTALQERVGFRLKAAPQLALAADKVRYVGEAVAVVVATDRYAAEDALELVDVEYEILPAVTDVEHGLAPGAPLVHEAWGDNVSVAFEARVGDPDRLLDTAPVRVEARIRVPRYAGIPMEPRGVLAEPTPAGDGLTVWGSTQVPHWLQRTLGETLGLQASCRRTRRGGRVRDQVLDLSRGRPDPGGVGAAPAARQVDRDPPRAPPERGALARAGPRRRAGGDAGRDHHRVP
jgi:hypothetical protein